MATVRSDDCHFLEIFGFVWKIPKQGVGQSGTGDSEQQSLQPYSVLFLSGQMQHWSFLDDFEGKCRPCRRTAGGGSLTSSSFPRVVATKDMLDDG